MTFSPLCVTCMYDRPRVSAIFLQGMKRLGIPVLAAVSENETWDMCVEFNKCSEYKVNQFMVVNRPLGQKWNTAIRLALSLNDWSHLLISGDDDLFSDEYLKRIEEYQDNPLIGIESTYMVSPQEKHALHFRYSGIEGKSGFAMGGGRVIKREIVEKCGDMYLPERNNNLEHFADIVLFEHCGWPVIIDTDKTMCVSIKAHRNIWPLSNFTEIAPKVDYELAMSILPEGERRMIDGL